MFETKKIFVTGGGGYVGAALVPKLLSLGYEVTVYDLFIFGENVIKAHKNLKIIKGDIRNVQRIKDSLKNHDTFIHLACISNDPSFELNPKLGKSINLDSFEPMIKECLNQKIKLFIYASSSSVYGLKNEKDIHEEISLEPLTDYSKYKAECEKILLKYQSDTFNTVVVRPATVCGYSLRQRMDVVVNILANNAYHKRKIKIFGGEQLRPNIHIDDMVDVYIQIIKSPLKKITGQIFNAGYQNLKVKKIADIVKNIIGQDVELSFEKTNDNRSYHISSKKIENIIGFKPKYSIEKAVEDLKKALDGNLLPNSLSDDRYFNIKRFESLKLK